MDGMTREAECLTRSGLLHALLPLNTLQHYSIVRVYYSPPTATVQTKASPLE